MKLVVQRVDEARVVVDGVAVASLQKGLLVLVGFAVGDKRDALVSMAKKLTTLRVFADENNAMNLNVAQVEGSILLVSQFTLYGDCSRGNRPSFSEAMPYQEAESFFNEFVSLVRQQYPRVQTGVFGAHMLVSSVNNGPVTLLL